MTKQALGRGLKALIPETPRARSGLVLVPVDCIEANPNQPRRHFAPEDLEELTASIGQHGVLQPLLVSESEPGRYVLIAGERRWRAARSAGLLEVPAVIRERLEEEHLLELALVENLQRSDLTPLEEARAYEQLRSGLGLSQAEIAGRVGINRSTVANTLRLLKLPVEIQEMVDRGELSAGHARTLLSFEAGVDLVDWARRTVAEGLSVRELERAAAEHRSDAPERAPERAPKRAPKPRDPNIVTAEEQLALKIGAKVEIRTRRRGGSIVISVSDQAELMRVYDQLMGRVADGSIE